MKHYRMEDMVKGWFVGAFSPTAHSTDVCEVAVKNYRVGDTEGMHHHRIATEITLVLSGTVTMAGQEWRSGDIIVLEPGDVTGFEAITDATTVVVKTPGALNDKYSS
jgi:quercetin dioxygenase-like cupin family protein